MSDLVRPARRFRLTIEMVLDPAALIATPVKKIFEDQNEPFMVNSMINGSSEVENPVPRFNEKARMINYLRALRNESG